MPVTRRALITFLEDNEVDPGYGVGSPGYPSQGLPSFPGRPDNSLPNPPVTIGTLPVFPFDPTKPSNELPGNPVVTPPIRLHPGMKLVVRWIACYGFVAVPDNTLPETPEPK